MGEDVLQGSLDVLSALQVQEGLEGLDAASKELLRNKEVLAIILKGAVKEYASYSLKDIMDFIETDSITSEEVSTGRMHTRIKGDNTEFNLLNEKTSNFDILFRSRNPVLSNEKVLINLHIDIEAQKNYRPGYPIEKRGIYYLARSLSSQLSVVTENTDYGQLEKCCSIWICLDRIPRREQYSISSFEFSNTKNSGKSYSEKKNYDLMELIIIRLGDREYSENNDLLRFLNTVFYPRKDNFMGVISEYIDFSENEELFKEVRKMNGYGQFILEQGFKEGWEDGQEAGKEAGEHRLGKLINILLQSKRYDDIRLVSTDEAARQEFYKKYNITD